MGPRGSRRAAERGGRLSRRPGGRHHADARPGAEPAALKMDIDEGGRRRSRGGRGGGGAAGAGGRGGADGARALGGQARGRGGGRRGAVRAARRGGVRRGAAAGGGGGEVRMSLGEGSSHKATSAS